MSPLSFNSSTGVYMPVQNNSATECTAVVQIAYLKQPQIA
ncbi:hypothetical protein C942_04263 [Photobacterium marinum]|uniref:Uncharacterized protein n=1 Tax=Photobacterium marinum TaxID=1056511 RepID=L8JCJ4_9GAMM|nr:hypothetical protein C942_04263 [Photobacterium marinum]